MDTEQALALLGGLTPSKFMKRHWQKKPLLVRNALPGFVPCVNRTELVALAGQEGVESRLIVDSDKGWKMRHGPLLKRSLPPFSQKKWTFLVQGVDLHHDGVHTLLQQFRFVPDARLDDLMISYATDGGGVGPHFDSYDVFLLQAHGQRRWRIGRQKDLGLQPGLPLKILQNFEATLVIFNAIWQIVIDLIGQILYTQSSHLVTLNLIQKARPFLFELFFSTL